MRSSSLPRTEPDRDELERLIGRLEAGGDVQRVIRLVEAWDREGSVSLAAGLAQARAFLRLRLMDRAWVRLRALDTAHPDQPEVLALTAQVFVERGWPARARKVLDHLRQVAPEHAALDALEAHVQAPPQGPPPNAREVERQSDPDALLQLAEAYLATGSFLRARSILERVRRARPLDQHVELLLWGLQGEYLPRGTTLAELVADALVGSEWEGVENTESARRPDLLGGADPPTAEVTRSMLVEAGLAEPAADDRFPSLFRRLSAGGHPGEPGEDDDVTVSAGLASRADLQDAPAEEHTDPGVAGSAEDLGGDTQIMQVIRGPGGHRLEEAEGPIHKEAPEPREGAREPLDLRAWQQSMGMAGAAVEELAEDDDFLEAEDEDLVVMTRREGAAEPAPAPPRRARAAPIEVIEKHPQPPQLAPPPVAALPDVDTVIRRDADSLSDADEPEPSRSGAWPRLVGAVAVMVLVMGGATALALRYLHTVASQGQIEDAERSLAAGDYRGLLELEARLEPEVRAGAAPLGGRALALALVEVVLWGEYSGNPDQRARAAAAIEVAREAGAGREQLALAEGLLALYDGDLERAAALSGEAGVQGELAAHLAARVALAQGTPAAGLAVWTEQPAGVRHQLLTEALLTASGDQDGASRLRAELLDAAGDNPLVAVAAATGRWGQLEPVERTGAIDALIAARRDELAPRQVGALYAEKAELLQELGQGASALDAWRRASSVDATRPDALLAIAAHELRANRPLQALGASTDCVDGNPLHAPCLRAHVQVLLELDRTQQAAEAVQRWAGPPEAVAPLAAWIAVQDERGPEAKPALVELVEAAEGLGEGLPLYTLGLLLVDEPGAERNAERSLDLAVSALRRSADPFDQALVERARAARLAVVDGGELDRAVRELLADGADDPIVHVWIARRYEAMGRRSAAAQHLETATRIGPEAALAWYARGQFWFAPATMDQAVAAWRRYLDLDPTGQRAARTQPRIR